MVRFQIYGAWFSLFLSILIFPQLSFCDEILFHEQFIDYDKQESIMYSVKDDGSGLVTLGNGAFPQRSPDKTYISYIKMVPAPLGCEGYGDLIIKDVKSDEIFPAQNFSKVDCKVVKCPPQPKKVDTLTMHHCTIKYCWNPDSRRVAYASILGLSLRDGFIYLFDVKTRQTVKLYHFTYNRFTDVPWGMSLSWSADGKLLLFNAFSMGSINKTGTDIYLLDPVTQEARNVATGYLPRFVDNNHILFSTGASLWIKNVETDENNKLVDMPDKVVFISKVTQNKVLLQTVSEKNPGMGPNLYQLDINNNKLESINAGNDVFYCPNLSPDGQKITVFGVNRGERIMGYYAYDLQTKQAKLLKALDVEKNRGFWFGLMFGYGNHTHWE